MRSEVCSLQQNRARHARVAVHPARSNSSEPYLTPKAHKRQCLDISQHSGASKASPHVSSASLDQKIRVAGKGRWKRQRGQRASGWTTRCHQSTHCITLPVQCMRITFTLNIINAHAALMFPLNIRRCQHDLAHARCLE